MVNALTFSYSANRIEVTRGGTNPELADAARRRHPHPLPVRASSSSGGEGMPMANWGSLGPYGGGVLWNQAPWLNNQDLYVLKDDYSAVFGKHFVKVGVLASFNKKNEEPANTSQESVQVNGTNGALGPNGYVPQRQHREHDRQLAAPRHGLEHVRDPHQPERPAALEATSSSTSPTPTR